jgi:hypothetical protein
MSFVIYSGLQPPNSRLVQKFIYNGKNLVSTNLGLLSLLRLAITPQFPFLSKVDYMRLRNWQVKVHYV